MCGLRYWIHSSGLRYLDCSSTIQYSIQHIFKNYPSIISKGKCTICSYTKERKNTIISVNLQRENLDFFDALSSMYKKTPKKL